MNISDISKVERKGSNLCVLFTRRNKDNHFDECSIKYSQAPHPDFERAWKNVLDELVAMVPEWEPVGVIWAGPNLQDAEEKRMDLQRQNVHLAARRGLAL